MRQMHRNAPNTLEEHEVQLRKVRELVMDWSIRIAAGELDPFGKPITWATRYVVDAQHQRDKVRGICHALGHAPHKRDLRLEKNRK